MITISKVLVPTDFSKGSEFAYRYANDLTKKFGGKVDLLHVIPAFRYLTESIKQLGLPFDMDKHVYPAMQKDSIAKLKESSTEFLIESVRGTTETIIDRKVDEAIIERAVELDYDLILIGAQGANENKLIHGSVTERVIRFSTVPVLSVPPSIPNHPIRKLLIPTDGSEVSMACLPYAVSMLDSLGGELTLFHVLEMYGNETENQVLTKSKNELEAVTDILIEKANFYLNNASDVKPKVEIVGSLNNYSIEIHDGDTVRKYPFAVKVVRGVSSHFEIVDYANDHSDMIIMTTHGRSGFSHILLGSTAETVARHSAVPVLTYKPKHLDYY
jgi:nucleotide-binding universal stress UspA family protein